MERQSGQRTGREQAGRLPGLSASQGESRGSGERPKQARPADWSSWTKKTYEVSSASRSMLQRLPQVHQKKISAEFEREPAGKLRGHSRFASCDGSPPSRRTLARPLQAPRQFAQSARKRPGPAAPLRSADPLRDGLAAGRQPQAPPHRAGPRAEACGAAEAPARNRARQPAGEPAAFPASLGSREGVPCRVEFRSPRRFGLPRAASRRGAGKPEEEKGLFQVAVSEELKRELYGPAFFAPYFDSKMGKRELVAEMNRLYNEYKKSKENIKQVYRDIQIETSKLTSD